MPLELGDYQFQGPFKDAAPVRNEPGVYVVLGDNNDNNFKILEVGESETLRDAVNDKSKKECWDKQGIERFVVAVLYSEGGSPEDRKKTKDTIKSQFSPPCG